MDLEDWEFLPRNDGFIDLEEDEERKVIYPRNRNYDMKNVLYMDYFVYPSQDPGEMIAPPPSSTTRLRIVPPQLVQVPISWEPIIGDKGMEDTNTEKEIAKFPIDGTIVSASKFKNFDPKSFETDQDQVSQVSFKKMKENEFVDMKMDSPKSNSSRLSSNLPQVDASLFTFDESVGTKIGSPRKTDDQNDDLRIKKDDFGETDGKLNIWKLSLTGVGAICSFGVAAAATICIIFFGGNQKNKSRDKNQRLRFQIYTGDKRIKQVVQHASRMNEAISDSLE